MPKRSAGLLEMPQTIWRADEWVNGKRSRNGGAKWSWVDQGQELPGDPPPPQDSFWGALQMSWILH